MYLLPARTSPLKALLGGGKIPARICASFQYSFFLLFSFFRLFICSAGFDVVVGLFVGFYLFVSFIYFHCFIVFFSNFDLFSSSPKVATLSQCFEKCFKYLGKIPIIYR